MIHAIFWVPMKKELSKALKAGSWTRNVDGKNLLILPKVDWCWSMVDSKLVLHGLKGWNLKKLEVSNKTPTRQVLEHGIILFDCSQITSCEEKKQLGGLTDCQSFETTKLRITGLMKKRRKFKQCNTLWPIKHVVRKNEFQGGKFQKMQLFLHKKIRKETRNSHAKTTSLDLEISLIDISSRCCGRRRRRCQACTRNVTNDSTAQWPMMCQAHYLWTKKTMEFCMQHGFLFELFTIRILS